MIFCVGFGQETTGIDGEGEKKAAGGTQEEGNVTVSVNA